MGLFLELSLHIDVLKQLIHFFLVFLFLSKVDFISQLFYDLFFADPNLLYLIKR